ncbi:glycosyltransferase family 2 protein [Candidatus Dojkabacteria bacterium]|jgi:glycosyltransferase involved in cell wall biosynthesis|nr:glycosyltransferase family 2 protein [Candidatus Dojkabacteria bacterium]
MKNDLPLVSVITTTYNGEKTIKRALRSILEQSYPNIELIVVDDGSTDNTAKAVESIKDKRIQLVRHKINRNGAAGRNTGIKASKGEYVAFLDDDDEWFPNKLKVQIADLQRRDQNIWKASVTSHYKQEGNCWNKILINKEGDLTKEILLMEISLSAGASLLIHKSAINKIGLFDEKYLRHQDQEYLLRYLREYKLAVVQEPLTKVYGHAVRIAGSGGVAKVDRLVEVKNLFLSDFKNDIEKLGPKIAKKIYARHWLQVARFYSAAGAAKRTLQYLKKSLSYALLFSKKLKIIPLPSYFAIFYLLLISRFKKHGKL